MGMGEKLVVAGGGMLVREDGRTPGGELRSLAVEVLAVGDEERVMAETGRR